MIAPACGVPPARSRFLCMAATPLPAISGDSDLPAVKEHRWSSQTHRVIVELAIVGVFYFGYSAVRNRFGSASVAPATAFENARGIIQLERSVGLFFEQELQALALNWRPLVWLLNVFYGTFHFVVTGGTLAWLFIRLPADYRRWRNTLATTTALAIVGFSVFPVMPPRLLADCGPYGACAGPRLVDTIAEIGGLWTFDSAAIESMSNQYAAVPSLHFAWSLWCAAAVVSRCRRRWGQAIAASYPIVTLFVVVVTANHYWVDAVLGALTLVVGAAVAGLIERSPWSRSTPSSARSLLDVSPPSLPQSYGVATRRCQGQPPPRTPHGANPRHPIA